MILFLGLAAPVSAEPLPDLFDVLTEIEGREVQATGVIGRFGSYGPMLLIDGTYFSLVYALPREKLKAAEACKLEMLSSKEGCPATVSAEITFDGADVDLLVFDIEIFDRE
jgi:hypothetical protein